MSPLHSRGSPNKGGQNQKWLPHPCLLGGPKEGRNAMSPLHSRGSPAKGTKSEVATSTLPCPRPKRGRRCYVTLAFSGIPKQRGTKSELAASPLPSREPNRRRKHYVTLHCQGSPNKGGQNQNWLPYPCSSMCGASEKFLVPRHASTCTCRYLRLCGKLNSQT